MLIAHPLDFAGRGGFTTRKKTTYLVVHCAATPAHVDVGAVDIDRWHTDERGFMAIGYHYVIRRDGTVERGRPRTAVGAHVQGFNSGSIGICLVGGTDKTGKLPEDNFTLEQYAALKELLHELRGLYPKAIICGHRDMSPDKDGDGEVERSEWLKYCPSFDVKEWWGKAGR